MLTFELPQQYASLTYHRLYDADRKIGLESSDPTTITIYFGEKAKQQREGKVEVTITPTIPNAEMIHVLSEWIISIQGKWIKAEPASRSGLKGEFSVVLQDGIVQLFWFPENDVRAIKFMRGELNRLSEQMTPKPH